MSHELRTPLNAIIGFAEMLDLAPASVGEEKRRDYVHSIRQAGEQLLTLVNEILDYSKADSQQLQLVRERFSIHDIVDDAMRMIRLQAGQSGVALHRDLPADLPPLLSDKLRLSQILLNLLSNAVKATPDGGKITVAVEPNGDDRFNLTVADTGIGMPPEMLETVFNPYDGTGNSYVRKEKGTGLGLAIVKRLVEMLRGEVSIASTPGEGTTVRMDLPLSFTE